VAQGDLAGIEAMIFDLDDTLYPEVEYVHSGFRAVSRQIAQLEPSLEGQRVFEMLVSAFATQSRDRIFNSVLEELGQRNDDQIIAELVSLYRCHRPILELRPAVRQMLEQLVGRFKLGLITDGRLPTQRLKIEALNLDPLFDHIICTEELGREHWKPSPKAFEQMAQKLGTDHEQSVYIADNPSKDFVAPNQLGWKSVWVKSPDRVHAHVEVANGGAAGIEIGDVTEVIGLI